jgi:hypothetical protein
MGRGGAYRLSFNQVEKQDVFITVLNISGQRVYLEKLRDFSGQYQGTINLLRQANGVYFIRIDQGDRTGGIKLVKY